MPVLNEEATYLTKKMVEAEHANRKSSIGCKAVDIRTEKNSN
jgi:hypothetical protein